MLRLAFARPPRVILSSLVSPSRASWIRYNSTAPSVPPSPPNVTTASEDAELDVPSSDVGSIPLSEGPFVNLKLLDPNRLPLTKPLGENFTETEHAATLIHGRGFHKAFHHPRTHDIPVANIQFRSHHPELLDLFTHFATHAASSLGIPVSRVATLPTKRTLWTVLRSPHVHKKSQENFERKVHKRGIKAWDADEEVVDRWCQYMRNHALGGVGMRVTKWKRMPLGIGKRMLAEVEKGREQSGSDSQKVKALAEKIAAEEMAKGGSS